MFDDRAKRKRVVCRSERVIVRDIDLMLAGALSGVDMGLELFGVPHKKGGVDAALAYLSEQAKAR